MSWIDLAPIERAAPKDKQITISITQGRNGAHPSMLISIRPSLIPDCPSWMTAGMRIGAMVGHGEHAGQIRITPKGRHSLVECKTGMKTLVPTLHLKLRGVPGVHKMKPRVVEFDYTEDWLQISIPVLDFPALPAPQASAPVEPPAAERRPAAPPPVKSAGLGKPNEAERFSMLGGSVKR